LREFLEGQVIAATESRTVVLREGKLYVESVRNVPEEFKTLSALEFGFPGSRRTYRFTLDASGQGESMVKEGIDSSFFSQEFFHRTRSGDLMARATNDLNYVRMFIGPNVLARADQANQRIVLPVERLSGRNFPAPFFIPVKKRPEFFYQGKVKGSPVQYSQAYVDWLIQQYQKDGEFFNKAKTKLKKES